MTSADDSAARELQPRKLAAVEPGDEIVISGMAGRFPDSDNLRELRDNLERKVDLVSGDGRRWILDDPHVPQRTGKVNNASKFDASFFGVHYKQAHAMDPTCRMLLEHAFEAVLDAGVNPRRLRGSRTGVFVGASLCESEKTWLYERSRANGFGITGCARAMLANRVSYYLGTIGPSYTVDSACSSSLHALEQAYRAMREGLCDAALVGSGHLCLLPFVSKQFFELGVLSTDGRCKTFDEAADGYARSEAVCALFLQRASRARRCYATLVHAKVNCDGFKEEGVTFPSSAAQSRLLREFYLECGVPAARLAYVEAHGTGTRVGDAEEVAALDEALCAARSEPLLVGSVKSNLGHCEPASGLVSVAKVLLAMESGRIPPNVNYRRCKRELTAILQGRLRVVTECTPWPGDYAAVNSFGFGGANAHVLLRASARPKLDGGAPRDQLPRLVVASGRTEEAVAALLAELEARPVDAELVALLHAVHSSEISDHLYRGYTLLPARGLVAAPSREVRAFAGARPPVCFVFSGMGSQWPGMGAALLRVPVFAEAVGRCDKVLRPLGLDVFRVIAAEDRGALDDILSCFVGIAAVQIGLVDLLRSLGVEPDLLLGHSVGELGCAYADGCFTAEQMILAAYSRGLASVEAELVRGSMAAVGLGYARLRELCPGDIDVACHNSAESATISGPAESMQRFVAELKARGVFAKEVPCANIPYHSRYIAPAGPKLLAYLKRVIPEPKLRSDKWLSSSVPGDKRHTEAARYSSAEYHTNNLLSPVLFEEAAALIPKHAIAIEIAPHGLLQAILRRSLDPSVTNVPLTRRAHRDGVGMLLQAIGKMFNAGLHPQLSNLYPAVEFPVSRSTPMISPMIKWQHTDDWYVTSYNSQEKTKSSERFVKIAVSDSEYEFLAGHVIDGRNLLPASSYLTFIWETLASMRGRMHTELSVVFEDVKFLRATTLPKDGEVELTLMVQKGTGRFEVVEGDAAVATGLVRVISHPSEEKSGPASLPIDCQGKESMTSHDVYKELKLRGYQYAGNFRGITRASICGSRGHIAWQNDWVAFVDNMLQMKAIGIDTRELFVPTAIKKLVIDSQAHLSQIKLNQTDEGLPVLYDKLRDIIASGGVEISGLQVSPILRRKLAAEPTIEEYKFVASTDGAELSLGEIARLSIHLAMENQVGATKAKTLELIDEADELSGDSLLSTWFSECFEDLPLIQADTTILTTRSDLDSDANVSVIGKANKANDALLVAGRRLLTDERNDNLNLLLGELKADGFLLTRENGDIENLGDAARVRNLRIVLAKRCGKETFVVLRKREKPRDETVVIEVDNEQFGWVDSARQRLQSDKGTARVLLVGQGDFENGLLGLVNCLRREPGGEALRAVLIQDPKAPSFSLASSIYAKQLRKDLAINVLRENEVWGTYRHLPLSPSKPRLVQHRYLTQLVRGDLSSLTWVEGPINTESDHVRIVYAPINFKDVMMATAKVILTARSRQTQNYFLGVEFSGIDNSGRRVMGIADCPVMSNLCIPGPLTWQIPDTWSLEDAATVSCVYGTCIYAFYVKGKLKKGHKILIHSGTGGVGQAAINLALAQGCEVFTTVSTPEKRRFIRDRFPEIQDDHIGSSRDTKFVGMIQRLTDGRGVDVVLNSLSEDKLRASVDCLAENGQFLEIGKYDLLANNPLGMSCFLKQISFHGVMLDELMKEPVETQLELKRLMDEYLKSGKITPLVRTVFPEERVEDAFRYMAAGKHMGKVLLKLSDDDKPALALPRYYCLKDRSYVVLGGLGGFGLELADWLVLRGARNLVLVSRSGVKNGYQEMRLQLWKSYGVNVVVVPGKDASSRDDCRFILDTAAELAPIDAVFNLAVVLLDALLENQSPRSFEESFKPKARATKNLDSLTRQLCPRLRHFVVFSSVSCGRGNAGQSNYGMSNSVMERICERRVADGLPGLAIQWGAIGDVGLVADMQRDNEEQVIGGTVPQPISSCLQELDNLLRQKQPVVSSMIVAAKKKAGKAGYLSIVQTVQNIMGLKDLKGVSPNVPLSELGMDSMMSVEVKQTLDREFGVFLTAQDVRRLNFTKLQEMSDKQNEDRGARGTDESVNVPMDMRLLKNLIDNLKMTNYQIYLKLKTKENTKRNEIFLIPGIEGQAVFFDQLAAKLEAPATCLQLGIDDYTDDSASDIAEKYFRHVLDKCRHHRTFKIVGYSFGSLIAIELVRKLEAEGLTGKLILIDGAPQQIKAIFARLGTDDDLQTRTLMMMLKVLAPGDDRKFAERLRNCKDWQDKVQAFDEICPLVKFGFPLGSHKNICTAVHKRLAMAVNYDASLFKPIKAPITLLKPTITTLNLDSEDYGLSKITKGSVEVDYVTGNHLTMLDDDNLVRAINEDTSQERIG